LASRRRRRKSIGKVVTDVERRVRRVEKRPGATRLKRNVVTGEKIQYRTVPTKAIQPDAITANEAEFGTTFVTATEPTEYLKEGTTWFDPNTGAQSVYDPGTENFIDATAIDATARASADGKNTIYRQDYEPTGGTYALGDTWFDTDDSNKIHRYSTAITATVTNKSLTSNVATLTVSSAHTFVVGETITVSGVDATFNGSYEVTATPTALTVRYAKTASNVASAGSSGTITNTAGWKGFALGDGALINIAANKITAGSLDVGVLLASNIDAGQINAGTINASIEMTSATITGGLIRQAASGTRIEMNAANPGRISFYSTTTNPGIVELTTDPYNGLSTVIIYAPYNTGSPGYISMAQGNSTSFLNMKFNAGILQTGNLGLTYVNDVSASLSVIRNIGASSLGLPDASAYYNGSIFLVYE
jgi:hypothetical protein